jgi:hypothetical protein
MSSYYYLISSLTLPVLGEKSPLSLERFMDSCSDWVSGSEYMELENVSLIPDFEIVSKNKVVNQWKNWENCLRNRVAKTRAGNLNRSAASYIQEERDVFSEIDRGVQEAYSAENPMLKEKVLDELRWKELDSLESGNQFKFAILCIYKLRLMLCEKWLTRESEKGVRNLDDVLLDFYSPDKNDKKENGKQTTDNNSTAQNPDERQK